MKHSEEKQYTQSSDPENFIPKFRRRNLDKTGFLNKLARFAGRLGEHRTPVVCTVLSLGLPSHPQTRQDDYRRRIGLLPQPYRQHSRFAGSFGIQRRHCRHYFGVQPDENLPDGRHQRAGKTGNREAAA